MKRVEINHRHALPLVATVCALLVIGGCSDQEERSSQGTPAKETPVVIAVSNYPLQYFVERLAPWANVFCPAEDASDPAYWKPTVSEVTRLQQTDLIVLNGASYETWLGNVSLSPSKVIDSAAGLSDRLIPANEGISHSHGDEGEHEHAGTAFTLWLDMSLAVEQTRVVAAALSARWPSRAAEIEQAYASLKRDLLAIDEEIRSVVQAAPDRPVLFSHPVYQYLERAYGLNGKSLHWEPHEMPSAEQWAEAETLVSDHPAPWMIWEAEPSAEIVARLETRGIRSIVFDPCAGPPSEGDFLTVMKKNVVALRRVYVVR